MQCPGSKPIKSSQLLCALIRTEKIFKILEISRVSDFTRRHFCLRFCIGMMVFLYVALIISVQVYEYMNGDLISPKQTSVKIGNRNFNWLYLLYIPAANFLFVYVLARHVLYCIMYPYQNSFQREALDRNSSYRFGNEFSFYLDCFLYTL